MVFVCHESAVILLFFSLSLSLTLSKCLRCNVLVPLCTIDKSSSAALTRRAHTIMNNLFTHRCTFHSAANFIVCLVALPRAPPPRFIGLPKMLSTSPTIYALNHQNAFFKTISSFCGNDYIPFVNFDFVCGDW
jgi:hypothetical protein